MSETLDAGRIVIEHIAGNCPVQAEGTVDGVPFYFRARGDAWSMEVGAGNTACVVNAMEAARHNSSKDGSHETEADARIRVDALPVWRYEEDYGAWPAAGWMHEDEARRFIAKAAEQWRLSSVTPLEATQG